ncbi:hypothetical protein GB931_15040 [Modestobacter sp. I12A-02628]|uniref:DUF3558 domain-containing protein n=1 Tax=Goekera deserti TaxID=2497753 RepID=A0A7K3WA72_9ACTN|nr:hypothetical protein [Goekera deserti]MPQ99209.1 hypothetical protein [Goekera deserti]NDI47544.1 hypothetical protein [Goekera deserti]NEL53355.1 hypothetical protein [Goekera deserti]
MTVRRPPALVGGALSSVGLMGVLGLAGCTAGGGTTAAAPSTTTPSSSAAAPTSAAPPYALPDSCNARLTVAQIEDGFGSSLAGGTSYVVGEPEPGIGRTGRVTCAFGTTPATDTAPAGPPLLELSVFTYTDAAAAADRVRATVEAQAVQGVRSDAVPLAGCAGAPGEPTGRATVLSSASDVTALCTVQSRTYALTFSAAVFGPDGTSPVAVRLLGTVVANDAPQPAATPGGAGPTGTVTTTG